MNQNVNNYLIFLQFLEYSVLCQFTRYLCTNICTLNMFNSNSLLKCTETCHFRSFDKPLQQANCLSVQTHRTGQLWVLPKNSRRMSRSGDGNNQEKQLVFHYKCHWVSLGRHFCRECPILPLYCKERFPISKSTNRNNLMLLLWYWQFPCIIRTYIRGPFNSFMCNLATVGAYLIVSRENWEIKSM